MPHPAPRHIVRCFGERRTELNAQEGIRSIGVMVGEAPYCISPTIPKP